MPEGVSLSTNPLTLPLTDLIQKSEVHMQRNLIKLQEIFEDHGTMRDIFVAKCMEYEKTISDLKAELAALKPNQNP